MRVGVTTAAAALASSGLYVAGPSPADTCSSGQCADGVGGSARLAVWGSDGLLAQLGIAAKDAAVMLTQDYHNADGSVNPYPVIVSSTQFLQSKCPGSIAGQEEHSTQVFHRGPWPPDMSCPKVLMNLGNVLKEVCSTLDCDRSTFAAAFHGAVTSFRLARGHADAEQRAEAARWHAHAKTPLGRGRSTILDAGALLNSSRARSLSVGCERVSLESSADLQLVLRRNRPTIISVPAAQAGLWDALRQRTAIDELEREEGDSIVPVSLSPSCQFATVVHRGSPSWKELRVDKLAERLPPGTQADELLLRGAQIHMAFSDAAELLLGNASAASKRGYCAYLEYLPLMSWLPEVFDRAQQAWAEASSGTAAEGWLREINLWMSGRAGAHSGLHFDLDDNLFFLARGEKSFFLYEPSAIPRLGYKVRLDAPLEYKWKAKPGKGRGKAKVKRFGLGDPMLNTFGSSFDPHENDDAAPSSMPADLAASAVHCPMRAGELLFLPALWSHDVVTPPTDEPAAGYNMWFRAQSQPPTSVERYLKDLEAQLG